MKNMKWNYWNGPGSLGNGLPDANSGERWRREMGPWVREMAGEVGDTIWSPAKEEAH
jgi:hypothetical protein